MKSFVDEWSQSFVSCCRMEDCKLAGNEISWIFTRVCLCVRIFWFSEGCSFIFFQNYCYQFDMNVMKGVIIFYILHVEEWIVKVKLRFYHSDHARYGAIDYSCHSAMKKESFVAFFFINWSIIVVCWQTEKFKRNFFP